MSHHIITLPGDGIGPEIMAPTLELLGRFGDFEFEEQLFGGASIDAHGVESLGDIEKTVAALKAAGVPMKPEIEGARGSRLRQSSTQAVVLPTPMRFGARTAAVPWTYAYFELAERPLVDGRRFEGFLGGQAANLFEMTRRA